MDALFRDHNRFKREEAIKNKLKSDHFWRGRLISEGKAEELKDINIFKNVYTERKEQLQLEAAIQRKQENEQQKIKEKEYAEKLDEKNRAATLQKSLRMQLKNTPELRELERKLLIAKVSKGQAIQRAQLAATDKLRTQEEEEMMKKITEEMKKNNLAIQAQEKKQKALQEEYHKALDQQIKLQNMSTGNEEMELKKEKAIIDQMIKRLIEEDNANQRKKIEKRDNYKKEIEECKRVKQEINKIEEERLKKDDEKELYFRLAQEHRCKDWKRKKKIELESSFQKQKILFNNLERVAEQKSCEENLRTELAIEEKLILQEQKNKMDAEKRARRHAETKEVCLKQIWLHEQQKNLDKKKDELYSKKLLLKAYEDNELDKQSKSKEKQKKNEERKIILDIIKERRERLIADKQMEMEADLLFSEIQKEKEMLVNQERQRILQENAPELLGFLPKGTLKDFDDVERLGENFKQFYIKKSHTEDEL